MNSSLSLHQLVIALFMVLVLVLVLIIGVIVVSYIKYKSIYKRSVWIKIIEDKIMTTVVEGYHPTDTDPILAPLLVNPNFRLLFLESLISSTRQFAGSALLELSKLFQELDKQGDAFKKLSKGSRIRFISDSIQALTNMKNLQFLPEIENCLIDSNPSIYLEAQYAMVRFKGFDGLDFLHNLEHLLSDWQQMRLLSSIKEVPATEYANITQWLQSPNDTVIIFTLRLIRKFQLLEFYSSIIPLQTHRNVKVRIQMVKALQALENETTIHTLIELFEKEEITVQKEILKVLKIAKNRTSVDFLKIQLQQSPSTDLQLIAADTLLELGEATYLNTLKESSTMPVSLIVRHVLQEKV